MSLCVEIIAPPLGLACTWHIRLDVDRFILEYCQCVRDFPTYLCTIPWVFSVWSPREGTKWLNRFLLSRETSQWHGSERIKYVTHTDSTQTSILEPGRGEQIRNKATNYRLHPVFNKLWSDQTQIQTHNWFKIRPFCIQAPPPIGWFVWWPRAAFNTNVFAGASSLVSLSRLNERRVLERTSVEFRAISYRQAPVSCIYFSDYFSFTLGKDPPTFTYVNKKKNM